MSAGQDNDTMPAMNNNVNSGLKFLVFGGKLRREKKQETKNENKEFPDFIHITKLFISSGGVKKDKILSVL